MFSWTAGPSAPAARSASARSRRASRSCISNADEQARAVDLVEVEPATGAASAHRVVIPEPEPADAAGRLRP